LEDEAADQVRVDAARRLHLPAGRALDLLQDLPLLLVGELEILEQIEHASPPPSGRTRARSAPGSPAPPRRRARAPSSARPRAGAPRPPPGARAPRGSPRSARSAPSPRGAAGSSAGARP